MKTIKELVDTLAAKAADASDSGDALRFSQAALNAANALRVITDDEVTRT